MDGLLYFLYYLSTIFHLYVENSFLQFFEELEYDVQKVKLSHAHDSKHNSKSTLDPY